MPSSAFHPHGTGVLSLYLELSGELGRAGARGRMQQIENTVARLQEANLSDPAGLYLVLVQAKRVQRNARYKRGAFYDKRDDLVAQIRYDLSRLSRFYAEQWGKEGPVPDFPLISSIDRLTAALDDDPILTTPRPQSRRHGRPDAVWLRTAESGLRAVGVTSKEDRRELLDAASLRGRYPTPRPSD